MSYVLLHADRLRSVVADDPLVPAAEVERVRDAAALLVAAGRLRDDAEQHIEGARQAAQATGAETGRTEGLAAAASVTTEALAKLHAQAAAADDARRGDVARLALEVVRRIAGDVGSPTIVAGIAERAASAAIGDSDIVVRVAEPAVETVRERLAARTGVSVEGDASLDAFDCVVETPLGRTHAGLETQLAAIGRAWGAT